MAGGGGDGGGRSLEETPTWAVSVVCLILVVISVFIEYIIHLTDKWLTKHNKRTLYEALEKIKSELMLLGFISLLLTVGQTPLSKICVSKSVGDSWHPCRREEGDALKSSDSLQDQNSDNVISEVGRRLLQNDGAGKFLRRILAGGGGGYDKCAAKGKASLISTTAIHQLHIFIFVLAVVHVIYSITIMALSRLKMRKWKAWEQETKTAEYQFSQDPARLRFTRETPFARQHLSFWSNSPILIWIVCFFRQFMTSVTKVDYLSLRHGFIMGHLAPHSLNKFDFHKYIKRSLEDDFKVVVGISPTIWFFAVLFLLTNTHGWLSYLWLPFIPLIVILLVGAKLQVIITKMAIRIAEHGDVVKGVPVVQLADNLFWFNRPRLLLDLIHFVLFQNAFQLAFFAWTWYEFGYPSCFHRHVEDIVIRSGMGVLIQILCSYVTLPLYALVTQMGSTMKPTIFNDRVATALRKWHHTARKHLKEKQRSDSVTPLSTSRPSTPTHGLSPVHLLQYYRSDLNSLQTSPRRFISDDHQVEIEESPSPSNRPTSDSSFHHQNSKSLERPNEEKKYMQPFDINAEEIGISVHDFSFDKREK